MIVVSDTTPLISLLKVGHLDLLDKYFGEVQIPQAVFAELTSNKRFALEAEEIRNCPYIRVVQIEDDKSVDIIRRVTGLDLGESEAIILTDNLHSDSKEAECSIFLSELMFDKAYTNFQNCVIFLRDIRPYIPSENIPYFIKITPGGDFCAK